MILDYIIAWLLCIVAVERSAELLTVSKFFAPLRNILAKFALCDLHGMRYSSEAPKSLGPDGSFRIICYFQLLAKFGFAVISCGWCTSMWTSMLFVWCLPGEYFSLAATDNVLVKVLALFGFANLWHAVFRIIHRGRVAGLDVNLRLLGQEDFPAEDTFNLDNNGETRESTGEKLPV